MLKWLKGCHKGEWTFVVCKSTDGLEVFQQIRHASSNEKIPPLNSSGVERKGVKAEPIFSWRKSGWTKFLMYCIFQIELS